MSSHNALFIPANTLFSFEFETSCFGQTVALPISAHIEWPSAPLLLRVREPKAQLTLTHYIEAIQNELQSAEPLARIAADAHAQLMMVWAQRYQMLQNAPREDAAMRLLRAFCALILQNELGGARALRMAEYASKLGVTPTHLTRVCKGACGLTAADLLTQHSLQRARRMLEDDGLKAVDIARTLGFSTPAYFTRFIKTHTNRTPSELRNSAKAARRMLG